MGKENLTIRLDPDIRAKLEFIAKRELRTLSNQITRFVIDGIECYMEGLSVEQIPLAVLSPQEKEKNSADDIPF